MLETLIASPLQHVGDAERGGRERTMARAAAWWAQVLWAATDAPPARGSLPRASRGESRVHALATAVQRRFRGFLARERCRALRALPREQAEGIVRLQEAMQDEAFFQRCCALEDAENVGGATGARAETMDQHEFVEALRSLKMLGTRGGAADRYKVSKTQAVEAFRASAPAAGRRASGSGELLFPAYRLALRRCLLLVAEDAAQALRLAPPHRARARGQRVSDKSVVVADWRCSAPGEDRSHDQPARSCGGTGAPKRYQPLVTAKSLLNVLFSEAEGAEAERIAP